jgi:hypothetical protein
MFMICLYHTVHFHQCSVKEALIHVNWQPYVVGSYSLQGVVKSIKVVIKKIQMICAHSLNAGQGMNRSYNWNFSFYIIYLLEYCGLSI